MNDRAYERRMLWIVIGLLCATLYSANEAHDHTHLAVNACSQQPVFAPNGKKLNDTRLQLEN